MTDEFHESTNQVYDVLTFCALGDSTGVERLIAAMSCEDAALALAYLVGLTVGVLRRQAAGDGADLLEYIGELRRIALASGG